MSNPKHIVLLMQGGRGWAGGTEYIRNLALSLASLPEQERSVFRLSLLGWQAPKQDFLGEEAENVSLLSIEKLQAGRGWGEKAFQVLSGRLPGMKNRWFFELLRKVGADFVYPFTYDNSYNINVHLPLGAGFDQLDWAGWIPDFQHCAMPELFGKAEIRKRNQNINLLCREAKKLVFSSEQARRDFEHYVQNRGKANTYVLHFHTFPKAAWFENDPKEAIRRWHLPEKYLLVCNQFWKHKNHRLLFEALDILKSRGVEPRVVCTGRLEDFRDKDYADEILRFVHQRGLARQVWLLGMIPREEQVLLLRAAHAVVQPSGFEGWSTVVEDARMFGRPMVLSDIAVHKEQNPPESLFFETGSADSLASKIEEMWKSSTQDAGDTAQLRERALDAAREYAREFLRIAGVREG